MTEPSNNRYNNTTSEITESSIEYDDDESNDYEKSVDFDDIVVSKEEDQGDQEEDRDDQEENQSNQEGNQSDQDDTNTESDFVGNNIKDVISNPVQELFICIFVNDSWTYASPIEKPYYSAKIYPSICYTCGSSNDEKM
ncbi:10287_t:CDS:2, partial [Cetraspora pellucida]